MTGKLPKQQVKAACPGVCRVAAEPPAGAGVPAGAAALRLSRAARAQGAHARPAGAPLAEPAAPPRGRAASCTFTARPAYALHASFRGTVFDPRVREPRCEGAAAAGSHELGRAPGLRRVSGAQVRRAAAERRQTADRSPADATARVAPAYGQRSAARQWSAGCGRCRGGGGDRCPRWLRLAGPN
ncbi:transcriptional regulatory protein AlgP-like [Schistocerca americana]|uniref:transcriptional regulatory protein AlgP-like n=1 Tax=Schistocerca americana TaxID=7009 RepID=UPI001F501B44|nr:transcriptional regulatory protein AlgP-like [Schistocerca americana]